MAKIKFGQGAKVEAQIDLPKAQPKPEFDAMKIVQDVIAALPKPEEKVDLSKLYDERLDNIASLIIDIDKRLLHQENKPEPKGCNCSTIIHPEVKQITHVKDVSLEVIGMCEDVCLELESKLESEIKTVQEINRKQKNINYILISALIITTLLHLL